MDIKISIKHVSFFIIVLLVLSGCAPGEKEVKGTAIGKVKIARKKPKPPKQMEEVLQIPDFIPLSEDISPLKARILSISARNTPLRDVLYIVAEATGLNIVMERGVDPEIPVTMTLNDVTAEDALTALFTSVDYFYSLDGNILTVKAMDTRIFEFGHPPILQTYSVDVGGDIIGGTTSGGGTSSTSGTLKGDVSQKLESDTESFNLWKSIESSLSSILGIATTTTSTESSGANKESAQASSNNAAAATSSSTSKLKPSFSVNRMAGTIVVTATKKDLKRVESYINRIKEILNRQVIVEAKIAEVQLSEGLKYGIDWQNLGRGWNGVGKIDVGASSFTDTVTSGLANFNIAVTGGGASFTSVMKALQQSGDVKVLSNPKVNIMNGQTALLSVGRKVDFISKIETTTTTEAGSAPITTFTTETSNVLSGILLGIIPYINSKGEISMTITPIISDLINLENKTFGAGSSNAIEISLPTIDLREFSTTVKVKDEQMIVLGGLIHKKQNVQENKIPILGDIPVMGNLFKSVDKTDDNTELVIMLKPKLVGN